MTPATGVPAGGALSGDLPRASFNEVVDDVGVPWPGDAACCVWEMPREAWLWDELEESFFFDDLLASFARDNCSCYINWRGSVSFGLSRARVSAMLCMVGEVMIGGSDRAVKHQHQQPKVTTDHSLSESLHFHACMDSHMYFASIFGASAGGRSTLARTLGRQANGGGDGSNCLGRPSSRRAVSIRVKLERRAF